MALASADEGVDDLESMDLTTCKERIQQLQADRERMQERTERLQEKLKALNNELASRRLEAAKKSGELHQEQQKNRALAEERREAGEDGSRESGKDAEAARVRMVIEDILEDKVGRSMKRVNAYGFRDFDEQDLMVERQMDDSSKEQPVDTVLVTWKKPNSDDVRYNLSYRVDNKTPSSKLRKDACDYWGLSEVEYVLLTDENSKVHDDVILQHCFKANERLQLILAQKNPRSTTLMAKEKDASAAISGKYAPRSKGTTAGPKADEDQSKQDSQHQTFYEWLKDKPGLWEFMTQRDMNVIHHLKHIKLRNIILYFLMFCATMAILAYILPVGEAFYLREGAVTALTKLRVDDTTGEVAKPYKEIRTREEAWAWLKIILSTQLLDFQSELRQHNYLPGWVRIRMQQVDNATFENCEPQDMAPASALCYDQHYNGDTAGKTDIAYVQSYWAGWVPPDPTTSTSTTITTSSTTTTTSSSSSTATRTYTTSTTTTTTTFFRPVAPETWNWTVVWPGVAGDDGRSNSTNPYTFRTATDNAQDFAMTNILGKFGGFDASGYSLDYDLQFQNMSLLFQAYRSDMDFLQEWEWISEKTRAVHVNFVFFNGDYDLWANCKFLLEMPVNSIVQPQVRIEVFRPTTMDYLYWQRVGVLDIARAIFLLYLLTFHFYTEAQWQIKHERSCLWYFGSFGGVADMGIAGLLIFIFFVRYISLGIASKWEDFLDDVAGNNYVSVSSTVFMYRMQIFTEAPILILLTFRFMTFMRVNRQLFVIWQTLNESASILFRFFLVLFPIFIGLTVLAYTIWANYQSYFSSLSDSALSIIMMAHGDVPVDELYTASRPSTLIFGVSLYIVLFIFLINGWAGVLLSTYQTVRVKAGFQPREYVWKEWQYVQWCFCWPCQKCYFNVLRPKIEKPKGFSGDEDQDADDKEA